MQGRAAAAEEGWRPTGDLVEIVGDRVEFRGRDSEVINVGGVKVPPLPVEERILPCRCEAGSGLRTSEQVDGCDRGDRGRARGRNKPEDLKDRIREAVADLPSAWHPRSIASSSNRDPWRKTFRKMESMSEEHQPRPPGRPHYRRQSRAWGPAWSRPSCAAATSSRPARAPASRNVERWEQSAEYGERFYFVEADVSRAEDADRFVKGLSADTVGSTYSSTTPGWRGRASSRFRR